MSLKSAEKSPSLTQNKSSKKSYLLAFAVSAGSLLTGLAATGLTVAPVASQAAGLGDLFSSDKSATQPKFLPVDEAFQVGSSSKPTNNGTRLAINFDITPEHYVYRDQIKLTLPAGVSAAPFTFSQKPVSIDDPTFGKVLVFDQANMVATTILSSSNGKAINNAAVTIGWQGCAKAGLCYPPEKIKTTVNIAAASQSAANSSSSTATDSASNNSNAETAQASTDGTDIDSIATEQTMPDDEVIDYALLDDEALDAELGATNTISGADEEVVGDNVTSEAANNDAVINNAAATDNTVVGDNAINSDPFGLASHPWLALVLLFLAGLGLALTPCVLPMLPIVANIVARQQNPTVKKGVILTTSYAIGVAIAYGILGAVIAVFGESLGIIGWLQNPIILIAFAIVFVLLAFYMLGVFSIRLPKFISSKMQGLSQAGDSKLGSTGGSLIAGFLSALVVSPCVSAPLFGALLAVSTI
ncbi:sulfite exporter TauE/SafE family protein, partial [Psychrobacter sp. Ps5]